MKPIAENHITITYKLFNEGSLAIKSKAYKKAVTKLAYILAFLCIAVGIWLLCTGQSLFLLAGEFIFMAALFVWLMFVLPKTGNQRRYKSMCTDTHIPPSRTTRFYEDHLVIISETGKEVSIPYTNVLAWTETKHLWLLNCKNNQSVMLKKDGFSIGDISTAKAAAVQKP